MKRLRIIWYIVCVVLLLAPASVIGAPAGPPEGLHVKIVEQPVEVTGGVIVNNDSSSPVPVEVHVDTTSPLPVTDIGDETCSREHDQVMRYYDAVSGAPAFLDFMDEVPSGQVFVIESLSTNIESELDCYPELLIYKPIDGVYYRESAIFYVPAGQRVEYGALASYTNTISARAVIKQGESLKIAVWEAGGSIHTVSLILHGYYTDANCPQP